MGGKKIYLALLLISFIACVGVVGYYFYSSNSNNLIEQNTTPIEDSEIQNNEVSSVVLKITNGGNTDYPQNVGGIDDFNNGGTIPADTYQKAWEVCDNINDYCGTKDTFAQRRDLLTGTIWSKLMSVDNWFNANNCKYPNGLSGDDGNCNTNNEIACVCVKNLQAKTGCESLGDGKWRLPYQKELLFAYIDGIYDKLDFPELGLWSATTKSSSTERSWLVFVHTGTDIFNFKKELYNFRCVR